eukprot:PhM_4_TR7668/c0_g1_i1/m.63306
MTNSNNNSLELHVFLTEKLKQHVASKAPYSAWLRGYTSNQRVLLDEENRAGEPVPPPRTVPLSVVRESLGNEKLHTALGNNKIHPVRVLRADPKQREFRERLRRLRGELERKEYNAMVRGVDPTRGETQEDLTMGKMLNETGMALDMRITTVAVAVVGYYLPNSLGWSPALCWSGAIIGAVVSLMVEMILAMIRIGKHDRLDAKRRKELARNNLGMGSLLDTNGKE